jgi:urocanate hydratase
VDYKTRSLDEALAMIEKACAEKKAISVGLLGNAAELMPQLAARAKRVACVRICDRSDLRS